ncbi:MAG: DUF309 domain-containing protein [Firmicutes bacterium]|nr:DUF309 domain-containing protein [Bacillota bacterium]
MCLEWEEAWSRYLEAMRQGQFFSAHEALEPSWRKARNPALQSAIWWAVLFHHWQRGNLAGALKMLEKLRRRFPLALPEVTWGALKARMAAGERLEVQRDLWPVLQALSSALGGPSAGRGENNR